MTEYKYFPIPDKIIRYLLHPTSADRLGEIRKEMDGIRKEVEDEIKRNPLVPHYLASFEGEGGKAKIVLQDDLSLEVLVEEDSPLGKKRKYTKKNSPPQGGERAKGASSKFPSLKELRERASQMGVDIADLGRKKADILQRLHEASEWEKAAKAAVVVPAPAPAPAPDTDIWSDFESSLGEDSSPEDEEVYEPPQGPRGFKKRGPAVPATILSPQVPAPAPQKQPSLEKIVDKSRDLDIDKILKAPED